MFLDPVYIGFYNVVFPKNRPERLLSVLDVGNESSSPGRAASHLLAPFLPPIALPRPAPPRSALARLRSATPRFSQLRPLACRMSGFWIRYVNIQPDDVSFISGLPAAPWAFVSRRCWTEKAPPLSF